MELKDINKYDDYIIIVPYHYLYNNKELYMKKNYKLMIIYSKEKIY